MENKINEEQASKNKDIYIIQESKVSNLKLVYWLQLSQSSNQSKVSTFIANKIIWLKRRKGIIPLRK
jgi:hypothetical protein